MASWTGELVTGKSAGIDRSALKIESRRQKAKRLVRPEPQIPDEFPMRSNPKGILRSEFRPAMGTNALAQEPHERTPN
jgi:hypothetical protein